MSKVARIKIVGVTLLVGIVLAGSTSLINKSKKSENSPLKINEDTTELVRSASGTLPTSYAPIIDKVAKSVVTVSATKVIKERSGPIHPFMDDPFFRDFFGNRGIRPEPRERKQRGLGSGVIISADGYILTNNHVVDGADEIRITMVAGTKKEYDAKVIGTDPKTDVALLKVDGAGLPMVTIADSSKVKVGDIVFAIGNPFGVGQTVTKGIVSATGRDIGMVDYEGFLQTDAAINPGNSGGALIDATGRLIGINTAIVSRSGGSQGIGFAIPVNMAKRIARSLIEKGSVSRGFLGVGIQDVTPELKEAFDLKTTKGALVTSVQKTSAAEKAGMKVGDVIVSFNGKDVKNTRELRFAVASVLPGETVPVIVVRDGKRLKLSAKLKEMDGVVSAPSESEIFKGVTLSELNQDIRRKFSIEADVEGLAVTDLQAESLASRQGIQVGDVIVEVNRRKIRTLADLGKATAGSDKSHMLLRIWRQGGNLFLVLKKK